MKANQKIKFDDTKDVCGNILQAAINEPLRVRLLLQIFDPELSIEQFLDNSGLFLKLINNTLIASQENLISEPKLITNIAKMIKPAIVLQALKIAKYNKTRDALTNLMPFGDNEVVKELFEGNQMLIKKHFPQIYDSAFCTAGDDVIYMLDQTDDNICNQIIYDDLAVSGESDRLIVNETYTFEDDEL